MTHELVVLEIVKEDVPPLMIIFQGVKEGRK